MWFSGPQRRGGVRRRVAPTPDLASLISPIYEKRCADTCNRPVRRSRASLSPGFHSRSGRSSMRTAPRCPAPAARRGAGRRRRSFVDDSRAILVRSTAARGSAAACARGHDQRGAVPPVCTARGPRVPPALSGRGAEPDGHTPPLLAREALDDGMDVALRALRWCRLRCSRPARKVQATSRCRRCAPPARMRLLCRAGEQPRLPLEN
jgi:hypothetical protein